MNRLEAILLWVLAASGATFALAWIAFGLQQEGIAPAVLFPLLVGGALGAALLGLARLVWQPGPQLAIVTAACWGLLLVAAQDYIGHWHRLRQFDAQLGREHPLAMAAADELRPSLTEHVSGRVRARPVWWTLDVLLTASAASLVVGIGMRRKSSPSQAACESGAEPPPKSL